MRASRGALCRATGGGVDVVDLGRLELMRRDSSVETGFILVSEDGMLPGMMDRRETGQGESEKGD
jgi:hypothetical protein